MSIFLSYIRKENVYLKYFKNNNLNVKNFLFTLEYFMYMLMSKVSIVSLAHIAG